MLDGSSDAKPILNETHRFEWLVSSLAPYDPLDENAENTIWEWRSSALGLLNALAGQGEDLEERCDIRGELRRRGLDHAIEILSAQEPTQAFMVQAEIYIQEGAEDLAELRILNTQAFAGDTLKVIEEEEDMQSEGGAEALVHPGALYEEISELRSQVSECQGCGAVDC